MLHLILQLLLGLERQVPDNSRLASSLFILGAWFLLIAEFFPRLAGPWRDWLTLAGWFFAGVGVYIYLRRRLWKWKAKRRTAQRLGYTPRRIGER
jgi:hypothetical protein